METLHNASSPNFERAKFEALIVEGYRHGKLGIRQVRELLGFDSRFEAEDWLGAHGVTWNYTLRDLEADRRNIARRRDSLRGSEVGYE